MSEKLHHIYCDESRQSKDRFMILGGVVIQQSNIENFNKTMAAYRKEHNIYGELKWCKVSKAKLEVYKRFIDYFFALNNTDIIHFKSLIIDNHKVDSKKFNDGDKETTFYKFLYQLLIHSFGRAYYKRDSGVKFIVYPDERNTKYSLQEFKRILNNGMSKKLGHSCAPFVSVEPKKSHVSEAIQINDIILGAIGYHKNGYNLIAGSSVAKVELAEYILKSAGLKDFQSNTLYSQTRFCIWNFKLQ